MKKNRGSSLGSVLVLSGALAAPLAAHAGEGAYIGLELGGSFPQDQRYRADGDFGLGLGAISDGEEVSQSQMKTGPLGGIVAGYKLYNGLRPEVEVNYTQFDFDQIRYPERAGTQPSGGNEKVGMVFGNIWYDIYPRSDIHPYIGGGVGGAYIDINKPDYRGTQLKGDDDKVLAYQAGFGVVFDAYKQVDLSIDYRYVTSDKGKYDLDGSGSTKVKMRYETQNVMATIRYYFGAPAEPAPPPPPPEPAPEPVAVVEPPPPPPPPCESDPTKTLDLAGCKVGDTVVLRGVNFDFDKATLTTNAKTLLDQVADALLARMDIKVQIAGHTDAFGSDAYNQKLSQERAASVVQYLTGRGIEPGRMTSIGFGESKPVADNETDEGREQNRRVELNVTETAAGSAPVVSEPASPDATVSEPAPAESAPPVAEPAPEAAPAEGSAPVDAPLPEATPVP